jgi:N-acetylglucosaminyldiphosphoundecaprenol N-acetyl-beta-D-mannosaminyltransferase
MLLRKLKLYTQPLDAIDYSQRALITTINPHSYNISRKDPLFHDALINSDILLPDGIGIVLAIFLLTGKRIRKIAGYDIFLYEMQKMQELKGKVFFLGSTEQTLQRIRNRIKKDYPLVTVEIYSPPFKSEFSKEDDSGMIKIINEFNPDILFIGMTAPKQEKWAYRNYDKLDIKHVCCIGAVFDFYAETIKRAPKWMITIGVEWLYRLIREFPRMWRRNLGSLLFIYRVILEKYQGYTYRKEDYSG